MIQDRFLTFCDDQRLLATGFSTDTVDLGQARTFTDDDLTFVVDVTAEVGSTAFSAELQTSADNSTFAVAQAVTRPAGQTHFGFGVSGLRLQRYNKVRFVISSGSPDVTLTAGLVTGDQLWRAAADSTRIA